MLTARTTVVAELGHVTPLSYKLQDYTLVVTWHGTYGVTLPRSVHVIITLGTVSRERYPVPSQKLTSRVLYRFPLLNKRSYTPVFDHFCFKIDKMACLKPTTLALSVEDIDEMSDTTLGAFMERHRCPNGNIELPVNDWDILSKDERNKLAERLMWVSFLSLSSSIVSCFLIAEQGPKTNPSAEPNSEFPPT